MTQPAPLTDQQLDEIHVRAGHLFEYVTLPHEADQLAGFDVPALLTEIRRQRDETAELQAENAKLIRWHREDEKALTEMRATIEYDRRAASAVAAGSAGDGDQR